MAHPSPFFDPVFAEQQRGNQFNLATGIADLTLRDQQLLNDLNLARPMLRRRFARQAEATAGNAAARGFAGPDQGVTQQLLGRLGEDQAATEAQLELGAAQDRDELLRRISVLSSRSIMSGAEGARGAAGRQAEMPNFTRF